MTGVPDVPPFRLYLAPGWEQHEVVPDTAQRLARLVSEKMRSLGRPELDAQLGLELKRSVAAMQKAGSKYVYMPSAGSENDIVPMSIVVSTVNGRDGASLDAYVAQLFREKGATFFDSRKSTVRWELDGQGSGATRDGRSRRINYVIPVPDTGRRKALLFTATVFYSNEVPIEASLLEACAGLSDSMLSTFAWAPGNSA